MFQESEEQLLAYETGSEEVGLAQQQRHGHHEQTTPSRQRLHASSSSAAASPEAGPPPNTPTRHHMDRMRSELAMERRRADELAGSFQDERRVWQEEKDKVTMMISGGTS